MRNSSLQQRTPLRRTKRINARSKKRAKLYREERVPMLRKHMKSYCEAHAEGAPGRCYGPLTPHEPLTRARGGSLTDPGNLRTVCFLHNERISNDLATMEWAYENGFLRR